MSVQIPTCKKCDVPNKPTAPRQVFRLASDRFICGQCGKPVTLEFGPTIPECVSGMVTKLMAKAKLGAVSPIEVRASDDRSMHPLHVLELKAREQTADVHQISCAVQWRRIERLSRRGEIARQRIYRPACVPCYVPSVINLVARILTDHQSVRFGDMFLTEVSTNPANRYLRFERRVVEDSSDSEWTGWLVRAQLSWTVPTGNTATLYIPARNESQAIGLLKALTQKSMSKEQARVHKLCFNYYTGRTAAQANVPMIETEAYLLCLQDVNPLMLGAALIDDGELGPGSIGSRYESLEDWWSTVSIETSSTKFGPATVQVLHELSSDSISLQYLNWR